MRLHGESLPLYVEELSLSPPSPRLGRVRRKKSDGRRQGMDPSEDGGMWRPQVVILVTQSYLTNHVIIRGVSIFDLSTLKVAVLVNSSVIIVNMLYVVNMFLFL